MPGTQAAGSSQWSVDAKGALCDFSIVEHIVTSKLLLDALGQAIASLFQYAELE